jgi:hypothetical protein
MVRGRIRPPGADLFSSASLREAPSPGANKPPRQAPSNTEFPASVSPPQYLLPKDLSSGIRQLTDQEFDRLLAAVLAEQKRRGKKLPVSRKASRKRPVQEFGLPLAPAKVNAVRAAFKAGVPPSRIARQFGISQADVRKALASGPSKRSPNEV